MKNDLQTVFLEYRIEHKIGNNIVFKEINLLSIAMISYIDLQLSSFICSIYTACHLHHIHAQSSTKFYLVSGKAGRKPATTIFRDRQDFGCLQVVNLQFSRRCMIDISMQYDSRYFVYVFLWKFFFGGY